MRQAHREPLTLPDAMLKDFGIDRSEIESIVRYGRADPSRVWSGRSS
jgi:uncharacterized protein YjiS (DUF1127 family)